MNENLKSEDTKWPIEEISLDAIWSPAFQRPVSEHWVDFTEQRWDPDCQGIPQVADSSSWSSGDPHAGAEAGMKGMYAVIDGQGRIAVMRRLGSVETVQCEVLSVTRQRAAQITETINKGRRDVKPFYRFRMSLAAENPDSTRLKEVVEACNFKLAPDTNFYEEIGAVTAIEDIFYGRRGVQLHARQDALTPTLHLIRATVFGKYKSLEGDFLRGLAMIFARNPDDTKIDLERLEATVAARTPVAWLEDVGGRNGDQRSRGEFICKEIVTEYNAGKLSGAKRFGRLAPGDELAA